MEKDVRELGSYQEALAALLELAGREVIVSVGGRSAPDHALGFRGRLCGGVELDRPVGGHAFALDINEPSSGQALGGLTVEEGSSIAVNTAPGRWSGLS